MPGVARVTSVVNLPGIETPAAAGRFWRAVQRPASSRQLPAGAGLPGLLQGLLGAQQREAALRLRAFTTAPGTALFLVVPKDAPTSVEAQDLAGASPTRRLRKA